MIYYNTNRKDDTMKELKLDGIVLKLNEVDKFQRIKDHIESCSEEEVSNYNCCTNSSFISYEQLQI